MWNTAHIYVTDTGKRLCDVALLPVHLYTCTFFAFNFCIQYKKLIGIIMQIFGCVSVFCVNPGLVYN